ncbi:MAG: hypothetical protein GXO85_12170, partial [Chlorobi bacterium]|nr:hypothetical protein [Chlorobiota bacterium]
MKFNFNNTDLANPILLISHNFNNPPIYFEITITEPKPGIASANIELGFPGYGTAVATTWTDIVTIRFTILSTVVSTQLTWRNMNPSEVYNPTVIYLDDETNQVTQGTFNTLDTSPLPVELTSFSIAQKDESTISLNWETATEVNNYGFEIERSVSTKTVKTKKEDDSEELNEEEHDWETIGFVEGHG